jgi:alpha 1,6-mannosyltransferase
MLIIPPLFQHSDMLRYLLLLLEGGIYSDTDTKRLKPLSEWGRGARLWKDGHGWLYGNDSGVELGNELLEIGIEALGPPSVVIGIEADVGDREDWHDWWPRPVGLVLIS